MVGQYFGLRHFHDGGTGRRLLLF